MLVSINDSCKIILNAVAARRSAATTAKVQEEIRQVDLNDVF